MTEDLFAFMEITGGETEDAGGIGGAAHASYAVGSGLFGPPDWRWRIACHLHAVECASGRRRRKRKSDPLWLAPLLGLKRVLDPAGRRRRRSKSAVPPDLVAAHQLYLSNGPSRWETEARILAGQTDDEIACSTGLAPAVVATFEQFFFNVRDRLAAVDLILFDVIGYRPVLGFEGGDLRGLWAYFGYEAGAKMLEIVMAVSQDRPLPAWVVEGAASPASVEQLVAATKRAILALNRSLVSAGKLQKLFVIVLQTLELRKKPAARAQQNMPNVGGPAQGLSIGDLVITVDSPSSPASRSDSDQPDPNERELAEVA